MVAHTFCTTEYFLQNTFKVKCIYYSISQYILCPVFLLSRFCMAQLCTGRYWCSNSVCLSVHLSVTHWHCIKTTEPIITQSTPHSSLVTLTPKILVKFYLGHPLRRRQYNAGKWNNSLPNSRELCVWDAVPPKIGVHPPWPSASMTVVRTLAERYFSVFNNVRQFVYAQTTLLRIVVYFITVIILFARKTDKNMQQKITYSRHDKAEIQH